MTISQETRANGAARPGIEILLVLFLSLGKSAVYSGLALWDKLTRPERLADQKTTINAPITPDRPGLDAAYQLAGLVFPLVPVFLALYLLRLTGDREKIGLDRGRPVFDLSRGLGAAALIGIPGLAFYYAMRAIGWNTNVVPSALSLTVVSVLILLGSAVMNGVLEEVIMLGFLGVRFRQLGWSVLAFVGTSALIRGSYHLYQGFGGFLGNVVMGLVFGWLYLRWRRVTPLVVAHILLDVFAFLGYALLQGVLPGL